MKLPKKPPFSLIEIMASLAKSDAEPPLVSAHMLTLALSTGIGSTYENRYLHWDELLYRKLPEGMTHDMVWAAMKVQRAGRFRSISLTDTNGKAFTHLTELPEPGQRILRSVDMDAGGSILSDTGIPPGYKRDQYIVKSLIEESITSSQIEGASTTRKVAVDMIRSGRKPRDRSEKMIFNNYQTMRYIVNSKEKLLSPELVLDMHRMITENTLDTLDDCGRLRRTDEHINVVEHNTGQILHSPPLASQLEERLVKMCDFANEKTPDHWIHPIVRSIILHFWLAYDHPFIDGNGRTARSLFYWSMLRHGYELFEYVSISRLIRRAQTRYATAFLHTETDDNDLTYFVLYHLDIIERAIRDVKAYLSGKKKELDELSTKLRGMRELNHRQRDLLSHALKKPGTEYTVKSHMTRQQVTHQTARTDLYDLVDRGLLEMQRIGRTCYFYAVPNLERKLEQGNDPTGATKR